MTSVSVCLFNLVSLLPRDAMSARYMLSSCVCPSACLFVCPSVTRRYCTKPTKHRITQTTSYDSQGALVFWCQRSRRNSNGSSPTGAAPKDWVGYNRQFFRLISPYVSESVQSMDIVTVEGYWELVFALLNSAISNNFEWPLTTRTHPICDISS